VKDDADWGTSKQALKTGYKSINLNRK